MTMPSPQHVPSWPPPQPKRRHALRNVLLSLLGVFVVLVAIGAALGGGNTDDQRPSQAGGNEPATVPPSTVGRGYAAHDASADAKITSCQDGGYGFVQGKVSITNHSPGRSDYYIQVVFLDKAGTNIGDGVATALAIDGNQRAVTDLVGTLSGKLATCKITVVQRTAS